MKFTLRCSYKNGSYIEMKLPLISLWQQLRAQISNILQSANVRLIEPQTEESNAEKVMRSSSSGSDLNIILRRSQWERRPPKYLENYKIWLKEYMNDFKKES